MKNSITKKHTKLIISAVMVIIIAAFSIPVLADEVKEAKEPKNVVTIKKPDGWSNTTQKIVIEISDEIEAQKCEAKLNEDEWEDITSDGYLEISKNGKVHARVTDMDGKTYEESLEVKCIDQDKPTVKAKLSGSVLKITATDPTSGIKNIKVNGTKHNSSGTLNVRLTQKNFKTKKITVTATDKAGNTSSKYSVKNPYYGKKSSSSSKDTSFSTTSDEEDKKSILPVDAQATEPTIARGTVSEVSTTNEDGSTKDDAGTKGKVFYTITTKSGKTFHMIIDNGESDNNVYLLTEVSEEDLLNFTEDESMVTLDDEEDVFDDDFSEESTEEVEATTETEEEPEAKMPEEKSPLLGKILLAMLVMAAVGIGYYFKVYLPKHEYDGEEEYGDDDRNNEAEEPVVNEDDISKENEEE